MCQSAVARGDGQADLQTMFLGSPSTFVWSRLLIPVTLIILTGMNSSRLLSFYFDSFRISTNKFFSSL